VHIAEGILPAEWCVIWAVPAAIGVAVGVRSLKKQTVENPAAKSLVALLGAAVFAISLMPIPVPVAGSVSHPAGTPLAAIVVGPAAAILIGAIALLIQALFFAHGGLTTLGANIVSEGIVGSLVGFGVFYSLRRTGRSIFWSGFAAGFLGDLAVYLTTATELSLGLFPLNQAWVRVWPIFLAFLPTQLPLALLEGVLTGGVLRSLADLRPDVAARLGVSDRERAGTRVLHRERARRWWGSTGRRTRVVVVCTAVAAAGLAGWGLLWSLAKQTSKWVGLDEGVMEHVAAQQGRPAWKPFINTDVGDLILYVFFVGAFLTGLVIGWLVRGLRPVPERPSRAAGRGRGRWVALGVATVLVLLVLWGTVAPGLNVGPLGGYGVRTMGNSLLHPTHRALFSKTGGDAMLFAFMIGGLLLGTLSGWIARVRTGGRLRVRLPHLHVHQDVRHGDRMAWQARAFGGIDARLKLAGIAALLVVNLVAGWIFSLALFVFTLGVLLFWQRVRPGLLALRMAPALVIAVMLMLLRGFTLPGRPLFEIDLGPSLHIAYTLQGMLAGARLGLVVLAGVQLMILLGLTTPLPELLSALRWYRVPEILIEIGMLMYRYLFLFVEEAARMRQAQKLRGPEVGWSRAMGGFSSLGANLLIRSYDRSQRVYDAQRLRGGGR
jgi:cobalt/nickel transport system permease protein